MGKPLRQIRSALCRRVITNLIKQHGAAHRADITNGVHAAARIWNFRTEGEKVFTAFCLRHYIVPGPEKEALLHRLDTAWGVIKGNLTMITKETRAGLDIADYPMTPAEELLGAFTPSSHLEEDLRDFHITPLVQLNFGTEATDAPSTRIGWAMRRLAQWGREVVPARLKAEANRVHAKVDAFVTSYNLYVDNIDFGDPRITFPKDTRLIAHWGLRDFMMEQYDAPHGVEKQRAILGLMRDVVDGNVPPEMLDNAAARWDRVRGTVTVHGKTHRARGHGALRWEQFRTLFHALRKIDPYTRYGNMIDAKFLEDREMAEPRVRKILTDILSSDVAPKVGAFLATRFGRLLEPFDIYYKKFSNGNDKATASAEVAQRFPNVPALHAAIPSILEQLGFERELAAWIGTKIRVDNGRSAGHAWSPAAPYDLQLLRVRVPAEGMNEREFGTFMHELGHCVEGVISSYRMDYRTLWGVPNSAASEAFAFTFQDRADEILGRPRAANTDVITLQRFWEAFEIAGPALVEIELFHWLYRHPAATAMQIHKAIRQIADRIWAKYHARIFGKDGHGILAAYSHILWCDLYLADYPLGYVCAYQIRRFLEGKILGQEMPRICSVGSLYPDDWMQNAVGAPIDAAPLLADTAKALRTGTFSE